MCMLARCIENRYGVDSVAMEWYQRAAEAGNAEAVEEIARLTGGGRKNGRVSIKDPKRNGQKKKKLRPPELFPYPCRLLL